MNKKTQRLAVTFLTDFDDFDGENFSRKCFRSFPNRLVQCVLLHPYPLHQEKWSSWVFQGIYKVSYLVTGEVNVLEFDLHTCLKCESYLIVR